MSEESGVALQVRRLCVRLRHERDRSRSLREWVVRRLEKAALTATWVTVLDGVSFEVRRGGMLAVVGRNGAGKTTLLRALAGIVPPAAGDLQVCGRVAPLIDLGAAFDPELTGDENVELFATLLGMPLSQVRRRKRRVWEFAGLSGVEDVPLRNYSAGMVARLGFAVATEVDPDVLLVDEVLAVGDEEFRRRCFDRIDKMRAAGTAIVLVTHDLELARRQADEAIWLENGKVAARGSPADVCERYRSEIAP